MGSETYRRQVLQYNQDIMRLQRDKGAEAQRLAVAQRAANTASARATTAQRDALKKGTSAFSVDHRVREAQRASDKVADIQRKMSDIEGKLARVYKQLADAQKNLAREEEREAKAQSDKLLRAERERKTFEERRERAHSQSLRQITQTLDVHTAQIEQLSQLPEKIVVLFLAASPLDEGALRLDEEARAIQEKIRMAEHRDAVQFETRWAVRSTDILQAINELKPTIVHFSGHGSEDHELVLQDDSGNAKPVSKNAITAAIGTYSSSIRLVVFNACFSSGQAAEVTKHVDAAIGMSDSIDDDAARFFAAQLYSAIGFGHSLDIAFRQAKAAIMLEGIPEEETPELFTRESMPSKEIILVRPEAVTE